MSAGNSPVIENSSARQLYLRQEAGKLIKYFLAALTIPEKDMWVNLSPYEHNKIIPHAFGLTEMGKELLAQDYLLKQVTASVMYPEGKIGREFWKTIYAESYKRFGTTNVPVSTFNKVWIVPGDAEIYENAVDNTAVIIKSSMKVMLEEDYLALQKHSAAGAMANVPSSADQTPLRGGSAAGDEAISNGTTHTLAANLIRQIIIPRLEQEINQGKNFAVLRQVYNSLILALWYKHKLKESLIAQGYVDRRKITGVNVRNQNVDEEIFMQYLKSYKKGVYNYIKEEIAPDNQVIPRKYFSGGVNFAAFDPSQKGFGDSAQLSITTGRGSAMLAARRLTGKALFAVGIGLAATFAFAAPVAAQSFHSQGAQIVAHYAATHSRPPVVFQTARGTNPYDVIKKALSEHGFRMEAGIRELVERGYITIDGRPVVLNQLLSPGDHNVVLNLDLIRNGSQPPSAGTPPPLERPLSRAAFKKLQASIQQSIYWPYNSNAFALNFLNLPPLKGRSVAAPPAQKPAAAAPLPASTIPRPGRKPAPPAAPLAQKSAAAAPLPTTTVPPRPGRKPPVPAATPARQPTQPQAKPVPSAPAPASQKPQTVEQQQLDLIKSAIKQNPPMQNGFTPLDRQIQQMVNMLSGGSPTPEQLQLSRQAEAQSSQTNKHNPSLSYQQQLRELNAGRHHLLMQLAKDARALAHNPLEQEALQKMITKELHDEALENEKRIQEPELIKQYHLMVAPQTPQVVSSGVVPVVYSPNGVNLAYINYSIQRTYTWARASTGSQLPASILLLFNQGQSDLSKRIASLPGGGSINIQLNYPFSNFVNLARITQGLPNFGSSALLNQVAGPLIAAQIIADVRNYVVSHPARGQDIMYNTTQDSFLIALLQTLTIQHVPAMSYDQNNRPIQIDFYNVGLVKLLGAIMDSIGSGLGTPGLFGPKTPFPFMDHGFVPEIKDYHKAAMYLAAMNRNPNILTFHVYQITDPVTRFRKNSGNGWSAIKDPSVPLDSYHDFRMAVDRFFVLRYDPQTNSMRGQAIYAAPTFITDAYAQELARESGPGTDYLRAALFRNEPSLYDLYNERLLALGRDRQGHPIYGALRSSISGRIVQFITDPRQLNELPLIKDRKGNSIRFVPGTRTWVPSSTESFGHIARDYIKDQFTQSFEAWTRPSNGSKYGSYDLSRRPELANIPPGAERVFRPTSLVFDASPLLKRIKQISEQYAGMITFANGSPPAPLVDISYARTLSSLLPENGVHKNQDGTYTIEGFPQTFSGNSLVVLRRVSGTPEKNTLKDWRVIGYVEPSIKTQRQRIQQLKESSLAIAQRHVWLTHYGIAYDARMRPKGLINRSDTTGFVPSKYAGKGVVGQAFGKIRITAQMMVKMDHGRVVEIMEPGLKAMEDRRIELETLMKGGMQVQDQRTGKWEIFASGNHLTPAQRRLGILPESILVELAARNQLAFIPIPGTNQKRTVILKSPPPSRFEQLKKLPQYHSDNTGLPSIPTLKGTNGQPFHGITIDAQVFTPADIARIRDLGVDTVRSYYPIPIALAKRLVSQTNVRNIIIGLPYNQYAYGPENFTSFWGGRIPQGSQRISIQSNNFIPYIEKLKTALGGQAKIIVDINEPNADNGYPAWVNQAPNPQTFEAMFGMIDATAHAIHSQVGSDVVVSATFADRPDRPQDLVQLLKIDVDAVGINYYRHGIGTFASEMHRAYVAAGVYKPVFFGEIGENSALGNERQATLVKEDLQMAQKQGISECVMSLQDNVRKRGNGESHWGILGKPAYGIVKAASHQNVSAVRTDTFAHLNADTVIVRWKSPTYDPTKPISAEVKKDLPAERLTLEQLNQYAKLVMENAVEILQIDTRGRTVGRYKYAEGIRQHVQILYSDDFFGGKVPYKTITKGMDGVLVKFSVTIGYDSRTNTVTVREVDFSSGKPVITIKTYGPKSPDFIQSVAQEGNAKVVTNVNYNASGTSATMETYRYLGSAPPVLLSQGTKQFQNGHWIVTEYKYSEGDRTHHFATTQSVISDATGTLLHSKTFNPQFNNTLLGEFVPSYDADGMETMDSRDYSYTKGQVFDRQLHPYDGTVVLGRMSADNKPEYYFRRNAQGGYDLYTVNGEPLRPGNRGDVVGRFINRGTVQLFNLPPAQSAYSGIPLSYIEEQNDQGYFVGVHYVAPAEDRVVANASKSTLEPIYEIFFNSALPVINIYGISPGGAVSTQPVAVSRRLGMFHIPTVSGPMDSMIWQRRDLAGNFQMEFGLDAWGSHNLNLYYAPDTVRYNTRVPQGYKIRGKAIVGTVDQPWRPIFHYNDKFQLIGISGTPIHGPTVTPNEAVGKSTRLPAYHVNIPSSMAARLPPGINTISEEDDFLRETKRFFALNTSDNRPTIEFAGLPSDVEHLFVAQVIYNPFTTSGKGGPDRGLYKASLHGGTFTIDAGKDVILTKNLPRHLSMDQVLNSPILQAAIGPGTGGSKHAEDARRLLTRTARDIARQLGGDAAKFTFNISRDKLHGDGLHYYVRIDQDPEARVIMYVSSDVQPSLTINMAFSGQNPLSAYEIDQDRQMYQVTADKFETKQQFMAENNNLPPDWREKIEKDLADNYGLSPEWQKQHLAPPMLIYTPSMTRITHYLLVNPLVDEEGTLHDKGKTVVLTRWLGNTDPLSRNVAQYKESALRVENFDESPDSPVPLTAPQGETAAATIDGVLTPIRTTEYFTTRGEEYIYRVVAEYKDNYHFTSKDNIFVGYNFNTGITWEWYVNSQNKLYETYFPIESVRVPIKPQEFFAWVKGGPAPQEYLYSTFEVRVLTGPNGNYLKYQEIPYTMTLGPVALKGEIVRDNRVETVINDLHNFQTDIFTDTFSDQGHNSLGGHFLPLLRSAHFNSMPRLNRAIDQYGERVDIKNNLPPLPPWVDPFQRVWYTKFLYDHVPWIAANPWVNNAITLVYRFVAPIIGFIFWMDLMIASPWRKKLVRRFRKSVNANQDYAMLTLRGLLGDEIARKLLILREINGDFVIGPNIKDEKQKKQYLESYLRTSGFKEDAIGKIWTAVQNKQLNFDLPDYGFDHIQRAEDVPMDLDEGQIKALIQKEAQRGYPQALALQELVDKNPQTQLKPLLQRIDQINKMEKNEYYKGAYVWIELLGLALKATEQHVFEMLASENPGAFDALKRLMITPQVRLLNILVKNDYFGQDTQEELMKFAGAHRGKKGKQATLENFMGTLLTEQIINPAIDDVYNSTFKYAGKGNIGITPSRLADVRRSIILDVHSLLMFHPETIVAQQQDKKAEIEYNPYPMSKLFETTTIRQFVLLKFIQMNPSDTGKEGYSLGALATNWPLAMFIVADAIRTLDENKQKKLSQEESAKAVLARLKAQADFWRYWAATNLWNERNQQGLFKMLTDPQEMTWQELRKLGINGWADLEPVQTSAFRQTHLFIDTDLYQLMVFLNGQKDNKGHLIFGAMIKKILAGGFKPTDSTKDRFKEMQKLVNSILEKGIQGGGSFVSTKELEEAAEESRITMEKLYTDYISKDAHKYGSLTRIYKPSPWETLVRKIRRQPQNPQPKQLKLYDGLMSFIKEDILTKTDVFKETMMVFINEHSPYTVFVDRMTAYWQGEKHLWLMRLAPLLFSLKSFWAADSYPRRIAAYALMAAGVAASWVVFTTQMHLGLATLTLALSLFWPSMLFGKVKFKRSRRFWMSVWGSASFVQFGLLVEYVFGSWNTIHMNTFGFLMTLGLFTLMTLPTVISIFLMYNGIRSHWISTSRVWSKAYNRWRGPLALLRFRKRNKMELYKGILIEAIDRGIYYRPVTANREPVQVYLKRVIRRTNRLNTDQKNAWIKFIDNPKGEPPALPASQEAQEFLHVTFTALAQKKPRADLPAYLIGRSSHVQAAGELIKFLMEISASLGSLDDVEAPKPYKLNGKEYKKGDILKTSLLGHLLDWHKKNGLSDNVLEQLRQAGLGGLADALKDISALDDIPKLLNSLNDQQIAEAVPVLERFINEVMANNDAVIESMGIEIAEMHIYMALHDRNYEYARAVDEIHQEYPSLKEAKEDLDKQKLDELKDYQKVFLENYDHYAELVALKYQPIFHENTLWAGRDTIQYKEKTEQEEGGYVFNAAKKVFETWRTDLLKEKLPDIEFPPHFETPWAGQGLTEGEIGKLVQAQQELASIFDLKLELGADTTRRPEYLKQLEEKLTADTLVGLARPIIKARQANLQQLIQLMGDQELRSILAKAKELGRLMSYISDLKGPGLAQKNELDRVGNFIENYNQFMQIAALIDKTDRTGVYLPFYHDRTLDNRVPANKNFGLGTNLWLGSHRMSENLDALVKKFPGQNAYGITLATLMRLEPDIMVMNPLMRVWGAMNGAFPVMKHYAVGQHTWTWAQRAMDGLLTFYGKGYGRPFSIDTMLSPPGEDSAAFLALQVAHAWEDMMMGRERHLSATSRHVDIGVHEIGRPTQHETMSTTDRRYAQNTSNFVMYRVMYKVLRDPRIGYDVKLTHLSLFMHYLAVRYSIALTELLSTGAVFTSFANLTPMLILSSISTMLLFSINSPLFFRHLDETGSFWTAAWLTMGDIGKAQPLFVGFLPMLRTGVSLATNGVFNFIRTIKLVALGGAPVHERDRNLHEFTNPADFSFGGSFGVFAAGAFMLAAGIFTWGAWFAPALLLVGLWTGQSGLYMMSDRVKFHYQGVVGTGAFFSWVGTLLFALPYGSLISLPFLFASITMLAAHKIYIPNLRGKRLYGVAYMKMFGFRSAMAAFFALGAPWALNFWLEVIDNDTYLSIWGGAVLLAAFFTLFSPVVSMVNVVRKMVEFWGRNIKNIFRKAPPLPSPPSPASAPVGNPQTPAPAGQAPTSAPAGTSQTPLSPGAVSSALDKSMLSLAPSTVEIFNGLVRTSLAPANRIASTMMDGAMLTVRGTKIQGPGGIDLSNTVLSVRSSGQWIQTTFNDDAMLRLILNSDGFTPIINDVRIMTPSMINHFVGLDNPA